MFQTPAFLSRIKRANPNPKLFTSSSFSLKPTTQISKTEYLPTATKNSSKTRFAAASDLSRQNLISLLRPARRTTAGRVTARRTSVWLQLHTLCFCHRLLNLSSLGSLGFLFSSWLLQRSTSWLLQRSNLLFLLVGQRCVRAGRGCRPFHVALRGRCCSRTLQSVGRTTSFFRRLLHRRIKINTIVRKCQSLHSACNLARRFVHCVLCQNAFNWLYVLFWFCRWLNLLTSI